MCALQRKFVLAAVTAACLFAAKDIPPGFEITPEMRAALDRISADSLRGRLSFLASDLLEGRDTPSRGLDIAAEFIAAQFRGAGLEPAGDDAYFQNARLSELQPNLEGFSFALASNGRRVEAAANQAQLHVNRAIDLQAAPVFKLDPSDDALLAKLTPEQLDGKVVLVRFARGGGRQGRAALRKVRGSAPALVVMIERQTGGDEIGPSSAQLSDPEDSENQRPPQITVRSDAVAKFYGELKPGAADGATAGVHIYAPKQTAAAARNVVAILRGSDPTLKSACVLLSAHYDHLGVKPAGEGDRIYNGANDDGSGTVSVVEIAAALARLEHRPKRSIVFATFFGEEKGGFGARHYVHHPPIPMKDTVADVNLEQLGRTDSSEGPRKADASLTGFDYTNLNEYFQAAGKLTGIRIYKHEQNSDLYFGASDNISLANAGVPATTVAVAFEYPDYHAVGDEWGKIDYNNMAKVDRMIAIALLMIADSATVPHWDAHNPKTAAFRKARGEDSGTR